MFTHSAWGSTIKMKCMISQLLNIVPYHCWHCCVISTHLQDKISDTQSSPAIAGGNKDVDCVLTLFQPSRFQELGAGRTKNIAYFANLKAALHRLNLSHTGPFPSKKQGHQLCSKANLKGSKAFPYNNSHGETYCLAETGLKLTGQVCLGTGPKIH